EDGMRDFHVTGVQTCALPILHALDWATAYAHRVGWSLHIVCRLAADPSTPTSTTSDRVIGSPFLTSAPLHCPRYRRGARHGTSVSVKTGFHRVRRSACPLNRPLCGTAADRRSVVPGLSPGG